MKILITNKILQYSTIFIFLCVVISANSQDVYYKAENYLKEKDYRNAALEYERVYYLSQNKQEQIISLRNKADMYRNLKEYNKAANTLERIPIYDLTKQEQYDCYYNIILNYYLANDFVSAQKAMNNINIEDTDSTTRALLFIEILVENELNNYSTAKEKALIWAKTLDSNKDKVTIDLCNNYNKPLKLKSEKKAKIFSYVPGLGQLYAGYYGEAVASFLINFGILTFGVYQAFAGCYITAYIGGAGMLSTTYMGQMKRVDYLIKKNNYQKTHSFNQQIKQILLEYYN